MAPRENEPQSRAIMNININRLHISNIRVRAASPPRAPSNPPPRPSGREQRVDTALEQLLAATDRLQRVVARLAQPRNGRNHPDEPGSFRANIAEHRARVPQHLQLIAATAGEETRV